MMKREYHFRECRQKKDMFLLLMRMKNNKSPYSNLYQNDLNYRNKQKRADAVKAAEDICRIIEKKKLKPRYKVALPTIFSLLIMLPDGIREKWWVTLIDKAK